MLYNINVGKRVVMYIRWKKNIRKKTKADFSNVTFCAVILENKRQDGKVKQKFLKYLGSIRENRIDSATSRTLFWKKASKNLDTLELSKENKASIIKKMLQVVPMSNHRNPISPPKF